MRILAATATLLLATAAFALVATENYTLLKTVPVEGDGGWDYLTVDAAGRRVYVSHGDRVVILDADTYEVKGTIDGTKGIHGIAIAPELNRGFTSNGGSNTVTIFDTKTMKKIGDEVKTGTGPDSIIYDPASKRVFAFNGRSKDATVIDAAEGKVLETIALDGRPEFAAADGAGNVYVNIEDKDKVTKIDSMKMKVVESWPLAPGKGPSSMAIDIKGKRIFVGCRSKQMIVVNIEDGKVVGKIDIGSGVDAGGFDPETKLAYCSCGDGTVTIVHEDGDDKYSVVETVKTKERSKTMALDPKTHNIFLPTAEFKAAAGGGRGTQQPKTFAILVYGKKAEK